MRNRGFSPRYYEYLRLLEDFAQRLHAAEVPAMAAQSAYYLILSVFPFLILLVSVLKYTPTLQPEAISSIMSVFPLAVQETVVPLLEELTSGSATAPIAALAGIWTASAGLYPITKGLNKAAAGDLLNTRNFFTNRLISLLFTLALLLLLIFTIATQLIGPVLFTSILQYLGLPLAPSGFQQLIWLLVAIAYIFGFLLILFRYSTKQKKYTPMAFKYLFPGAIISTLGIGAASFGFRFYVNNFARYTVVYGSIAGIMVLCIWFFIISYVMIFGGIYSLSYANYRTSEYPLSFENRLPIPILTPYLARNAIIYHEHKKTSRS
ncbi:MAG: YihY/virulence factor BrkB family protein [Tissierellia bacterium]|nr:YihY/virulence factor BrkB family protein [Tissierellia bacterium]